MTLEERKKLYAALSAPFPEDAIERTDGRVTGKGYSTTGIKYQYVVNRLNEVLGFGCFRIHRTVTVREFKRSNGRPAFEAMCDLTLELGEWVQGQFAVIAESLADGGHVAASEVDARKGATSSAFKKAAAFFGVGRQAYEGTLDDDNVPAEEVPQPQREPQAQRAVRSPQSPAQETTTPKQPPEQHEAPPGYVRTTDVVARPAGPPQQQVRNRISSKQLSAIWALARRLGFEQGPFRGQVKTEFGATLEFLNRDQASELITRLSAKASNGHDQVNGVVPAVGMSN